MVRMYTALNNSIVTLYITNIEATTVIEKEEDDEYEDDEEDEGEGAIT